jgi:signal transduction histidine kinase
MDRRAEIADEPARSEELLLTRFEHLLVSVSSTLIAASAAEVPGRVEASLREIVHFFGVDRSTLAERSPAGEDFIARVTYGRPGVPLPVPVNTKSSRWPWLHQELTEGRIVRFGRMRELPPEAVRERETGERMGLRANLTVPVLMHGTWRYALGITSFTHDVDWPDVLVPRVKILAEMFAHAYEHARAERELKQQCLAAQQAIRVRDDFLSVASHELRTPCTSLKLAVQALSRDRAGRQELAPPVARRFFDTIEQQVSNLNVLVDRLLDVSLIAGGQLQLERSRVDLGDVARAAVARLQELLRASGSALIVDAPEPVVGSWDRVRIEEAATNLVANAIKFGAGAPIEVMVGAEGDAATLIVRDHGIGIPLVEQARIFERFERAVSSANFGGFGLGLYITNAIVNAHGGSIALTSHPGEGSTFVVRLPLASESRARHT